MSYSDLMIFLLELHYADALAREKEWSTMLSILIHQGALLDGRTWDRVPEIDWLGSIWE